MGRLNERIIIEGEERLSDQLGGYSSKWKERGQYWAKVEPYYPRVSQKENRIPPAPLYKVRVRCGIALCPGDRLRWKGCILLPLSFPHIDTTRTWVEVIAKKEISNGACNRSHANCEVPGEPCMD